MPIGMAQMLEIASAAVQPKAASEHESFSIVVDILLCALDATRGQA